MRNLFFLILLVGCLAIGNGGCHRHGGTIVGAGIGALVGGAIGSTYDDSYHRGRAHYYRGHHHRCYSPRRYYRGRW